MMLLAGCASRTEVVSTEVITVLPPAGLIVPCEKPTLKATSPAVTASEDIPKLKAALHTCSAQVDDYLNWRSEQERKLTKRDENDERNH